MSNGFDYRCPKCGDTDSINICAEVWVRLVEDGTDDDEGSRNWEAASQAACHACDYQGLAAEFDPEEDEAGVQEARRLAALKEAAPDLLAALEDQAMADADPEASRRKGYFKRARESRRAALSKAGREAW